MKRKTTPLDNQLVKWLGFLASYKHSKPTSENRLKKLFPAANFECFNTNGLIRPANNANCLAFRVKCRG